MNKNDINIIYNNYYNNLKYNDIKSFNNSICKILLREILDSEIKIIYLDIDYDYYQNLYHYILNCIFNDYPDIQIISPFYYNNNLILCIIDKNTKFILKNNNIFPNELIYFNGEFIDYKIVFLKYFTKDNKYELINDINLSFISSVKTIGVCYFEPIYYDNNINSEQADIIIYNDTFYEF
jgi:hypothetical protein